MTEQINLNQINQSGATRGQGLFWDGLKWIVGTVNMLFTVSVASTQASAIEKMFANYVCDGVNDEVEINQALQDIKAKGGTVQLSSGAFLIASSIYIEGYNDLNNTNNVGLVGCGSRSTALFTMPNIDAIVLRYQPMPTVKNLFFLLQGTACGIKSIANTAGPNDRRGFWQGEFRNLFFSGGGHTGWVMNLENPFRSDFNMIQTGNGIANGIWLKSVYQADQGQQFNPGNCTFKNVMMGLDVANGVGYRLQSNNNGGQMNLNTFEICDAIDANSSSTSSIGWDFQGSNTTYYSTKNNTITSSNVEGFNTAAKFSNASDNDVNLTFVNCQNGGTMVDFSSNSQRNKVQVRSGYVPPNETQNLVVDANGSQQNPNTIGGFNAYVDTGATLTCSPSTSTIIKECISGGPGTISPLLTRYTLPANQLQRVNVSPTLPTTGQVLGFSAGEWRPTTISNSNLNLQTATVDFGDNLNNNDTAVTEVINPSVLSTSTIIIQGIRAGIGRDPDELEMETLVANVGEIRNGSFDLYLKCLTGGATNQYIVQYTI
jgi:hypothetical protein